MNALKWVRNTVIGAAAIALTALPVFAQYEADDSEPADVAAATAENAPPVSGNPGRRSGYAHVTAAEGGGSVLSDANGRTNTQINLPLAESDQVTTAAGGRAEIELADGNRVQIAGESRIRLDALAGEDGSSATESAVTVLEGSVAVEAGSFTDSRAFRVDTPDASVYVPSGAQARINLDPHHGTSVVARRGSLDVQTRSGSIPVQAGQYVLVQGDQQPELARGTFSRDRFDVWVADRTETLLQAHNSTSARYLEGDDYDEDVAALDDYGRWDYSSTYGTNVWRPNVDAGWSPYSDGYWYDTPAGATWVDNEPWGWFPHHFGNWFFDAGFGSWCWSPAYAYSPAWVYWGFADDWVGWCPVGYYSGFAPWWNYWGGWGWGSGFYFSINGLFDFGGIDCRRGWNFVGGDRFGGRFDRRSLVSGATLAGRLGSGVRIAVTSNPLRVPTVSGRGSGATALRAFARSAPATIARRVTPAQSATLAPFLARGRSLPAGTVQALRQTQVARVDPATRRLQGPGAASLPAARRGSSAPTFSGRALGGGSFSSRGGVRSEAWRNNAPGAATVSPRRAPIGSVPSPSSSSSWRGRSFSRSEAPSRAPMSRTPSENWRSRSAAPQGVGSVPRSGRFSDLSSEGWRSRAAVPPAQRVIEGIDRGRALPGPRSNESWRSLPERRPMSDSRSFDRGYAAPRMQRSAPPSFDRRAEPSPRFERQAPPPRFESRMAPQPRFERSAPPPRFERSAPAQRFDSRPAPPRFESRPAPSGREMRSAPPPRESRSAPRSESHSHGSNRSDHPHR